MTQPTRLEADNAVVVNNHILVDGDLVDRVAASRPQQAAHKTPQGPSSFRQMVCCCCAAGLVWGAVSGHQSPLGYVGIGFGLICCWIAGTGRSFH